MVPAAVAAPEDVAVTGGLPAVPVEVRSESGLPKAVRHRIFMRMSYISAVEVTVAVEVMAAQAVRAVTAVWGGKIRRLHGVPVPVGPAAWAVTAELVAAAVADVVASRSASQAPAFPQHLKRTMRSGSRMLMPKTLSHMAVRGAVLHLEPKMPVRRAPMASSFTFDLFNFLWGDQSPHAPRNANREHGVAMFPVRIS